jgi:spore coat polysaccharide biosynthesis protein SpsF
MTSSRLPGKVMMMIFGESLLYRMIERLQMIQHPAQFVVAIPDEEQGGPIEQECERMGIPCFCGDRDNVLDRHYRVAKAFDARIVLKIPSDCPLIDPRIIDQVLDFYFEHEGEYDYVSNLHPATFPDGNDVEIMTMDCLERTWKKATRQLELEHTTPYIWENQDEFRIGNVVWNTSKDYSMSHRFTIDYMDDYEFIKTVFEELYPGKPDFSCDDILELLERRPDIYEINSAYSGVNWYRNHLDELKTISAEQTRTVAS